MDDVENLNENQTPDEASLLKDIANLKSSDIDRLVDIARNNIYNSKKRNSKSMTDYFSLLDSVFSATNFNSIGNNPYTRNQRYEIYDEMDESTAYISSALDILSDDATQADEDGVIIHVSSESEKIISLVEEFIEDFELEDKVSKWARAVAKYGDLFVNVEGNFGQGISYINDTIYPSIIDRRDLNGKLVAFANNQSTVYANEDLYAPWEFVHFRHKGDIYKEQSKYDKLGLNRDLFEKNLTSAYGQSVLRPAIKVYAQLRFVENMILLSRLTNSIRRNIFLINVGETSPDKAFDAISQYAKILKKDINLNIEDGIYSSAKHTVKNDEDIFLPVGDPNNDVRIEQLGGDYNVKEAYDLEYLLNKLFAALKVPKAYLNYEQDLNARSTLIQLDIRYARSVGQLQHTVVSGIRRLINIHLAYLGLDPDELDLDITLTSVSAIDEETRVDQQQKQVGVATDTWNLLSAMKDSIPEDEKHTMDLTVAAEHIMRDYLELDQDLINKVFNRDPNNLTSSNESSRLDNSKEMSPARISKKTTKRSRVGTDLHAMYPTESNQSKYESIRESIISQLNNSSDDHPTAD